MKFCFIQLRAYELFNRHVKTQYGGAEVQMYLHAVQFAKDPGNKVDFLVGDYGQPESEQIQGITVIRTSKSEGTLASQMISFFKALKKSNADVYIQMTLTRFSFLIAFLCRVMNKKFIYLVSHDDDVSGKILKTNRFMQRVSLFVYPIATKIVAQNNYQEQQLQEYKTEIMVIRSALPGTAKHTDAQGYHLWMARAEKWKQPEVIIRLAQKFPEQQFYMVCPAFAETDALYYNDVRTQASSITNLHYIDIYISLEETEILFSGAATFINTSGTEGFPTTFLHAAKYGKPVLSLNINPDNILTNERIGIFCNNDEWELHAEFSRLLHDAELYRELSENCIAYFNSNHNSEINSARLHAFITK